MGNQFGSRVISNRVVNERDSQENNRLILERAEQMRKPVRFRRRLAV
jgi:hypothetical protein